jgi:hypothetical protein
MMESNGDILKKYSRAAGERSQAVKVEAMASWGAEEKA